MGYYTGSGQVVSGGKRSDIVYRDDVYVVYQTTTSTVTLKNGVSLAEAQAAQQSRNLSQQPFPTGAGLYHALKGNKTDVSYSRVDESNLYALTIHTDAIEVAGS